jgi:hypothetical protein
MPIHATDPTSDPGRLMVHFVLADGSHEMDAWVLHSCEGEILGLVKEVAKMLDVSLRIEAMAHGEGGVEVFLNLVGKHAQALTLIGGAVAAICSGIVWMNYQTTLLAQQIEANAIALDRDKKLAIQQVEQGDLNLKKTRLELKKLENEVAPDAPRLPATASSLSLRLEGPPTVEAVLPALLTNRRIIKLRSQFYESLLAYNKVTAVGFALTHAPTVDEEARVPRSNFSDFVVRLEELEPTTIENADIEIIAPVLVRDGGKWRGRFNKHNISFTVRDEAFLTQVALKRAKFQNGTTLICKLTIFMKEDEAGVPQPHDYVVFEVHSMRSRSTRKTARQISDAVANAPASDKGEYADGRQGDLLPPET